ncbi:MAG TPA: hypothetical protein VHM28_02905 [Anaerolineales bacterium]|jgi:hypothetical protein|nr:hypothetical protein [Anaerolineales bacterium]
MNKKEFSIASLIAVIVAVFSFQIALAHTTVHVGDYDVEIGWVDEPAVVGQRNAIVVNVSNTKSTDAIVDVSKLTVTVAYGGQTKTLELQPLSEDSKNEYIAPILPTIPGQYTVQLRGQLDSTNISEDVQPEEVASSDELAFPSASGAEANNGLNWSGWLSILGLISGLAGLTLGLLALRKK